MTSYFTATKFLPASATSNFKVVNFFGSDTNELFQSNLKTKPSDWEYRTKSVTYTLNSDSYRCPEWSDIDWKNSCVIFGCSHVFGIGLDDSDTISSQLSKLINRPVINMGMGGTSMQYSFYNSVILHNNYPTPWAVVQLWTSPDRITFYNNQKLINIGQWTDKIKEFNNCDMQDSILYNKLYQCWNRYEDHSLFHAYFTMVSSRNLWKDKTRYVSSNTTFPCSDLLRDEIDVEIKWIDNARDYHFGKLTAYETAKNLKKFLIVDNSF